MKSITMLYPAMEAHKTGCRDIARSLSKGQTKRREQVDTSEVFEGDGYDVCILKVDQASCEGFGETFLREPYASEPWLISNGTVHVAPCLNGRVKQSTIDRAVQMQKDKIRSISGWTVLGDSADMSVEVQEGKEGPEALRRMFRF